MFWKAKANLKITPFGDPNNYTLKCSFVPGFHVEVAAKSGRGEKGYKAFNQECCSFEKFFHRLVIEMFPSPPFITPSTRSLEKTTDLLLRAA